MSDPGHPLLLASLHEEIRARGPIPFARFMERALYDEAHGYYTTGASRLGPGGDFVTASDLGGAFAGCIARQVEEIDALLGRPGRLDLVDWGGGRGWLARDVLRALHQEHPDLHGRVRARVVDRSSGMLACAREQEGVTVETPPAVTEVTGCIVACELFDALPVHRLRRREGRLVEVCVGSTGTELVEVEVEPAPGVRHLADRYGAARLEGTEAEVCPALEPAVHAIAGALARGVVLVFDYGAPARELYGPARRRGTLLAYTRHRTSEDLLVRVGLQDLTAHVNFTHLEDAARASGLEVLGATTQDRFLVGTGLLQVFEEGDERRRRAPAQVARRAEAMQLLHPAMMGRRFRVLVLAKGLAPDRPLRGLVDPFPVYSEP